MSKRNVLLRSALWTMVACCAVLAILPACDSSSDDEIRAGFNGEFLTRPDGWPGLSEAYDFQFASKPMQMDTGLMYRACRDRQVDVICGFATDGLIPAFDLVMLEDDQQFFPPYYAAPLVRGETLQRHPEIRDVLNQLAGRIDEQAMQKLNLQATREDAPRKPSSIARDFLIEEGLITEGDQPSDGSAGTITVAGKDFTEQDILGEIVAQLIEHKTELDVDRKMGLGGTMVCFAGLRGGDIDIYVEYTGTGLQNILPSEDVNLDVDARDSDAVYAGVKQAFQQKWNLVWLQPLGFNNTYAMTMRKAQAQRLGIETISELAEYVRAHSGGPAE